jgi:anti-sigma regulatory factor (Ser/Thr protein kinase)
MAMAVSTSASAPVSSAFAPQLSNVAVFGRWLNGTLASCYADSDARFGLELAAVELFTNIVRHGRPRSAIRVVVRCTEQGAEIELSDDAAPCNMARLDGVLPADPLSPEGRGIFLVRRMTDSFRYRRTLEGNTHTLSKRLA